MIDQLVRLCTLLKSISSTNYQNQSGITMQHLNKKGGVHNPLILIAFFHLNWQFTLFCGPRKRSANCPWPNLNWFYIIHDFGDYDEAVNKQNTYIMWPMSGATWDFFFFYGTCSPYTPKEHAYQIIVADAADAVSVNFSGRCKFLQI